MSFLRSASIAFVTVSYAPDRERCALLTRSIEALAPSVQHYIVVDQADRRRFASLESSRTTLLTTEEVLPVWVYRVRTRALGLRSNLWIQARGKPIRGWLVQQLVKLSLAEKLDAGVLVHADSDVVLVRPFEPSSIVDLEGRWGCVSNRAAIDARLRTTSAGRSAERLLSIEGAEPPCPATSRVRAVARRQRRPHSSNTSSA